jgi:plasmid stabilization system protein ParE
MVMRIEWSEQAKEEAKVIFDYLVSVAGKIRARRIVEKIYARPGILAKNPFGGQREWMLDGSPHEYRRLVEGNYKIIYRVDGYVVYITAIWDCRRDPEVLRQSVMDAEN